MHYHCRWSWLIQHLNISVSCSSLTSMFPFSSKTSKFSKFTPSLPKTSNQKKNNVFISSNSSISQSANPAPNFFNSTHSRVQLNPLSTMSLSDDKLSQQGDHTTTSSGEKCSMWRSAQSMTNSTLSCDLTPTLRANDESHFWQERWWAFAFLTKISQSSLIMMTKSQHWRPQPLDSRHFLIRIVQIIVKYERIFSRTMISAQVIRFLRSHRLDDLHT